MNGADGHRFPLPVDLRFLRFAIDFASEERRRDVTGVRYVSRHRHDRARKQVVGPLPCPSSARDLDELLWDGVPPVEGFVNSHRLTGHLIRRPDRSPIFGHLSFF